MSSHSRGTRAFRTALCMLLLHNRRMARSDGGVEGANGWGQTAEVLAVWRGTQGLPNVGSAVRAIGSR